MLKAEENKKLDFNNECEQNAANQYKEEKEAYLQKINIQKAEIEALANEKQIKIQFISE